MSQQAAKPQAHQEQTSEPAYKFEPKQKLQSLEELKSSDKTKLQHGYTIWAMISKHQQSDSYENVLKPIANFDTIEDFWAVYSHLRRPTQMSFGTLLHIFKEGVKPMWEDETCKDGGKWSMKVQKQYTNKYWEDLTLAMIGEQFSVADEINGIMISLRPNFDTIQVWNKTAKDQEAVQSIKSDIEQILKLDEEVKLSYEGFAEAIQKAKEPKEPKEHREYKGDKGFSREEFQQSRGRGRGRGFRGGHAPPE